METLSIHEKLKDLSIKDTTWREKAIWRQENSGWLERAAKIAIIVLSTLRNNRNEGKSPCSQKELADILNVSPQQVNKIVKGSENLTLETISHLEKALGINLIEISNTTELKTVNQNEVIEKITETNDGGYNSTLSKVASIRQQVTLLELSSSKNNFYLVATTSAVAKEVITSQELESTKVRVGEYSYAMAS